jgi:ElaB/YqjD/DUF883 family membrane-anchored ribosome-binding protein
MMTKRSTTGSSGRSVPDLPVGGTERFGDVQEQFTQTPVTDDSEFVSASTFVGSGGESPFGTGISNMDTDQRPTEGSSAGQGTMDKAREGVDQVKSKMGGMTEGASQGVDTGMNKAASGLDSLASTVRDKSESMGDGQMQSVASMAADKLQSGADLLHNQSADELISEIESFIRRKPAESLLIAAGLGFMLSRAK